MATNPEATGHFILAQRQKLNLSQAELAKLLHVEPQTVSKWERGLSMPDYDNIDGLMEIFNCSYNDIFAPVGTGTEYETDAGTEVSPDNGPEVTSGGNAEYFPERYVSDGANHTDGAGVYYNNTNGSAGMGGMGGSGNAGGQTGQYTDRADVRFDFDTLTNEYRLENEIARTFGEEYRSACREKYETSKKKPTTADRDTLLSQGMFRGDTSRVKLGADKPWLWVRVLLVMIVALPVSVFALLITDSPALVMFFFPLAILLPLITYFFEVNFDRDVSVYNIFLMLFAGGLASIIATLYIGNVDIEDIWQLIGFWLITAPVTEEFIKAALVILVFRILKPRTALSGILIGLSVGAGFVFFETMSTIAQSYAIGLTEDALAALDYAPGGELPILMNYVINPVTEAVSSALTTLIGGHHYLTAAFAGMHALSQKVAGGNKITGKTWIAYGAVCALHVVRNAVSLIGNEIVCVLATIGVGIFSLAFFLLIYKAAFAEARVIRIKELFESKKETAPEETEAAPVN